MINIRIVIKRLLGKQISKSIGKLIRNTFDIYILIFNYYNDLKLFYNHSMVFKQNTFNKLESRIILHYHSIEKGFLHKDFKYRFGQTRVLALVELLKSEEVVKNHKKSQISAAYLSMCKYYEKHEANNVSISDYYSYDDYCYFKSLSSLNDEIIKRNTKTIFFDKNQSAFFDFSKSRMSTRSFTDEKIPIETIYEVIDLAKTAPSVCNRQPWKVYFTQNKEEVDNILEIQQGLKGYSEEISQLLILVTDRNYFYSIGERNQMYIDGGIFLMNLLYSLHYFKIAACPAHWGFTYIQDKKIQKLINLNKSEKVICLIPIGIPKEEFNTTLSLRRKNEEILKVL